MLRTAAWLQKPAAPSLHYMLVMASVMAHTDIEGELAYRPSPDVALVLATIAAASWHFGIFRTVIITSLTLLLTLAKQLASTPEVNAGHRAGGKGFQG